MKCAAVFIFVSFALASQALAVLRPLFPAKPSPPYNGEMVIIGDDWSAAFAKRVQLNREMSSLEKSGAEIEESAHSNLNVDRLIAEVLAAAHVLI